MLVDLLILLAPGLWVPNELPPVLAAPWCAPPSAEETLMEQDDRQVRALLQAGGMDAFTRHDGRLARSPQDPLQVLDVGVLAFEYGFLRLVRGIAYAPCGARQFSAIDLLDVRSAVLNACIVDTAHGVLEEMAERRLAQSGVVGVALALCPDQGHLVAEVSAARGSPDESALLRFWLYYLDGGRLRRDLDRAFGLATVARAHASVPDLAAVLCG